MEEKKTKKKDILNKKIKTQTIPNRGSKTKKI